MNAHSLARKSSHYTRTFVSQAFLIGTSQTSGLLLFSAICPGSRTRSWLRKYPEFGTLWSRMERLMSCHASVQGAKIIEATTREMGGTRTSNEWSCQCERSLDCKAGQWQLKPIRFSCNKSS